MEKKSYRVTAAYMCVRTHLQLAEGDVVWRDAAEARKRLRGHRLVKASSAAHHHLICDAGAEVIELVPVRGGRLMGGAVTLHVPRQLLHPA